MDVLGSKKWATGSGAQDYLDKLYNVLTKSRPRINSKPAGPIATLTFTDNVVLGCPFEDDFEDFYASLGLMCFVASAYQAELASQGIFVRGAVSSGLLYMDQYIAFGEGLVWAYEAEREAIYPRIVLTKQLAKLAKYGPASFLETGMNAGANADFAVSDDGLMFLNYLAILPFINDEAKQTLAAHKQQIQLALKEFANDPHVWEKYRWLADYHNFAVLRKNENPDLFIDVGHLRSRFELSPIAELPTRGA